MGTKDAIADKATGTLRPKTEAPSRAIYILRYTILVFAVLMAWCLSFFTRLEWVPVAKGNQLMQWEGNLLPTTHDSYVYLSVIQQNTNRDQSGEGLKNHPKKNDYGALTDIGVLVCRHSNISPMIFAIYFPAIMAGVISIPIVLIGRLYGSTLSGFGAACLTAVSYTHLTLPTKRIV